MFSSLSLLLHTETCAIKCSFVSIRISVFFRSICVHAPRARVWDISISSYCMVIALILLIVFEFLRAFKCNKYLEIDRRLEVSLI